MTQFTPFLSLAGGVLTGLSAVLLMASHGRIAGMTGILGNRAAAAFGLAMACRILTQASRDRRAKSAAR